MSTKTYKNGLVLGKFMPIHLGHCHLISTAANGCDNLTVLAGSIKKEPIPGYLRAQWVKHYCDSLQQNINVVDLREELPQLPEEDVNFWDIWCDVIRRFTPNGLDVIYSSEDYGYELAKRLDIKHELVDKERSVIPISGTKIREKPYENWKYIYSEARSYFINRVYFLGPESVGKTTMAKKMSEKFDANWVPEYGRILYERKCGNLEFMDFCEIVIKQREIESALSKKTDKQILFCDTDVITTKVFCDLYYPEKSHELTDFFNYHIKQQLDNKYHYFVISPNGAEAVQDGTRKYLDTEQRILHFNKIINELKNWNVSYTILNGTYEHKDYVVENLIKNINKEKYETVDNSSVVS